MTDARDIVERDANDGLVCSGCGSTQSIEQIRTENPKALSCCPERRMVPQISDIVERLRALHVWPQFVADEHADVILPRQSKGLYEVGHVAHEAADTIASLRKQLEDAREALRPFALAAQKGSNVYAGVQMAMKDRPDLFSYSTAYIDAGRSTAHSHLSWSDYVEARETYEALKGKS